MMLQAQSGSRRPPARKQIAQWLHRLQFRSLIGHWRRQYESWPGAAFQSG
jgi:hypothetical protein